MSLETTIALVANVAIALSFVVAFVFGIFQVHAAHRDRKERFTIEILKEFQSHEFAEVIYKMRDLPAPANQEAFMALPAEAQIMLIQVGQQMEHLGMLVYEKLVDLDLVDKTIGSYIPNTWAKYKAMFTDMREKLPDPFLGEYFQWLAERVEKTMNEEPREPYYKDTQWK